MQIAIAFAMVSRCRRWQIAATIYKIDRSRTQSYEQPDIHRGNPLSALVLFADGFAGASKEPGGGAFRPTGPAAGPDGAR